MHGRHGWFKVAVAAAVSMVGAVGCGSPGGTDSPAISCAKPENSLLRAYAELINALGDPQLSREDRRSAAQILAKEQDDRIIPMLIEATDDSRLHDPTHQIPNGGEDQPRVPITAGEKAEILLYFKLCRNLRSNYRVDDWKQWWAARSSKTVDEIRDEIDAWDKEHSSAQPR
jgi:hypothetical protein